MATTHTKQEAHELIDRMAPGQVSAVVDLLEVMLDPSGRALANAPLEDESISEEEEHQAAASRASFSLSEVISHQDVLAEFGLSKEDFERMGRTPLDTQSSGK